MTLLIIVLGKLPIDCFAVLPRKMLLMKSRLQRIEVCLLSPRRAAE
jgi:hypothetical protein